MSNTINLYHITYTFSNGRRLFDDITLFFSRKKTGIVGRNGVGKSTLFQLILGNISPTEGSIQVHGSIAYVPQKYAFTSMETVGDVLGCIDQINALHQIQSGSADERHFIILNDQWDIAARLKQILSIFKLEHLPYHRYVKDLSGGEITRLWLAKAFLSNADFILLDEPTNHLDVVSRETLYEAIRNWPKGMIVISHDRALLNLMDEIVELTTLGANVYGGNFDFYQEQKEFIAQAHQKTWQEAKKMLRKTADSLQASREKHAKRTTYGKRLKESGSIDKMAAGSKKGRSERSQSNMLIKEERILKKAADHLNAAKDHIEILEDIHIDLPKTNISSDKIVLELNNVSFRYEGDSHPIIHHFDLSIKGPERIALLGPNGCGKTTLIQLIQGELSPYEGTIKIANIKINAVDQHAHLLNGSDSVLDNFRRLNPESTLNDAHRALASFLFRNVDVLKKVRDLSGGESIRALLACVLMSNNPPQLLILDEPTNHLDLRSVSEIESALKNYQGAMIVISHDFTFLRHIGIERELYAPFKKIG